MTRVSADACVRAHLPGWPLEWVYVDGMCSGPVLPGQLTISSLAQQPAHAGDVEPGNPGWAAWVPWVVRCRTAGLDPYLYCCDDGYGGAVWNGWRHADGVAAFSRAGVPEPHWWVFNDHLSFPPAYAELVQVAQGIAPGYDVSICRDYLPGIDPAPPPVPAAGAQETEPMATVGITYNGQFQTFAVNGQGALNHRWYDGRTWAEDSPLLADCLPFSTPTVAVGLFGDPERIDVCAQSVNGGQLHAWYARGDGGTYAWAWDAQS